MKKTILSIAIIIGSLIGSSAICAQTPAETPAAKETTAARPAPKAYKPFEGLNLSEKQMSDLKALSDAQREQLKQSNGPRDAAKLQQDRKDNLYKIKEILTPEQYIQFLENCYLNPQTQRMGQGQRGMRQGRDGQRGPRGDRGPRGQRPQQQDM